MSDLQRGMLKSKPSPLSPLSEDERLDKMASSEERDDASPGTDSASSASSTGTVRPAPSSGLFAKPKAKPSHATYAPLPWDDVFPQTLRLTPPGSAIVHHAYYRPPRQADAPLFALVHGAGATGLTFAALLRAVAAALPDAGLLASDLRGHGETRPRPDSGDSGGGSGSGDAGGYTITAESGADDSLDMGLDRLAVDLEAVLDALREREGWPELPGLVLVGHSLGGAVATRVASSEAVRGKVLGLCVLDVVEGSAVDALSSMSTYLATRPTSFPTLEAGIEWHVRSRTIRNADSARISVPSYLTDAPTPSTSPTISPTATPRYTFRTPLAATAPYWPTWFAGLSAGFLGAGTASTGRLLVLAGTDRLDTPLTVAQMQGRFQLAVVPNAGHFVHEDRPARVAEALVGFARRVGAGEADAVPLVVNGKLIRGAVAGAPPLVPNPMLGGGGGGLGPGGAAG